MLIRFLVILAIPLSLLFALLMFAARMWGRENPDPMLAYMWSNGINNIVRVIDLPHATEIELGEIDTNFYSAPTWSADGRLAFVSARDGNLEIYVWDGTSLTNVSNDSEVDYAPVWGLDGRLAFISRRTGSDQVHIWDGTSLTNISQNLEVDRRAAWSRDGRLAVMSYHEHCPCLGWHEVYRYLG
jgi:hypothetical protein